MPCRCRCREQVSACGRLGPFPSGKPRGSSASGTGTCSPYSPACPTEGLRHLGKVQISLTTGGVGVWVTPVSCGEAVVV